MFEQVVVPPAGGISLVIEAVNIGKFARGTTLSVIFRGQIRNDTLTPYSNWVPQFETALNVTVREARAAIGTVEFRRYYRIDRCCREEKYATWGC